MRFDEAIARLQTGLAAALPGPNAHQALAPRPRRSWPAGFNAADARQAAGLILVFPAPGSRSGSPNLSLPAHIILTVRADRVRHGGQVSLPGGVVDPGETIVQAALREAEEEVGLVRDSVTVLGQLTPLDIPVSGFRLHPIVGALDHEPAFRASDGEVARILDVDIDQLLDASNLTERTRTRDGRSVVAPAFHIAGVDIWGATAMVLAEFLVLLGWRQP